MLLEHAPDDSNNPRRPPLTSEESPAASRSPRNAGALASRALAARGHGNPESRREHVKASAAASTLVARGCSSLRLQHAPRIRRSALRSIIASAITVTLVIVAAGAQPGVALATPLTRARDAEAVVHSSVTQASVVTLPQASPGLTRLAVATTAPPLRWSAPSHIDGVGDLSSVSCPSPSFCMAVDLNNPARKGNALTWNGTSWSAPTNVDPNSSLASVSCSSASFCMAVGDSSPYFWNGSSWSPAPGPAPYLFTPDSVSCPSTSFCMGVPAPYGAGYSSSWNGTGWSFQPRPSENDGHALFSVSCPSASFCMGLDFEGNSFTWDGTSWSGPTEIDLGVSPSNPNSSGSLPSLSCASASFCMLGAADMAYVWNGTAWSGSTSLGRIGDVLSVSCPSASFCVALGGDYGLLAVSWNGKSWSAPTELDAGYDFSPTVASVSCPSASFCMAVEENGDAVRTIPTPSCEKSPSLFEKLKCYWNELGALRSAVVCTGDLLEWGFGPLKLLKGAKTLKGLYDLRRAGKLKSFYKVFNRFISTLQKLNKFLAKRAAKGGPGITKLLEAINSKKVRSAYDLTRVVFAWGLAAASSVSRQDLKEFVDFFDEFVRDLADLAGVSDCVDLVLG